MIRFLAVAEEEFAEAIVYYNEQREGLGHEFAEEVKRGARRIDQFPTA
jgi:hypothetical protein